MSTKINLQSANHITTITIDNPSKMNALDDQSLNTLGIHLENINAAPDVRVLVLTGEGQKAFCAGYSIEKIDVSGEGQDIIERIYKKLREMRIPVIAMLNGAAIGAGLDLILNCDIVIAASDIKLGITPAKLGIVYHQDGLKRLAQKVGVSCAKELLFTGNLISAQRALEIGLANMVVDRNALTETVMTMAVSISENAPLSIYGTKEILNAVNGLNTFSDEQHRQFLELRKGAFGSKDFQEGKQAFQEKRKPVFQGL